MKYLKYVWISFILIIIVGSVPILIKALDDEKAFYIAPVLTLEADQESVNRIQTNANYFDFKPNEYLSDFVGEIIFDISVRENEHDIYFGKKFDKLNPFASWYIKDFDTKEELSSKTRMKEFDGEYQENFKVKVDPKALSFKIPDKAIIQTDGNAGKNGYRIDPNYEFALTFSFSTYIADKDSFLGFDKIAKTEYMLRFTIKEAAEVLYFDFVKEAVVEEPTKLKFTDMISIRFKLWGYDISNWLNKDFKGGE